MEYWSGGLSKDQYSITSSRHHVTPYHYSISPILHYSISKETLVAFVLLSLRIFVVRGNSAGKKAHRGDAEDAERERV
jgi:hypothetical protein